MMDAVKIVFGRALCKKFTFLLELQLTHWLVRWWVVWSFGWILYKHQNRDDALSPTGIEQIVKACREQLQRDAPTVVRYSLAASCIDTANVVGRELRLGSDRLVPEFTFLDQRGLGGTRRRIVLVLRAHSLSLFL